MYKSKLLTEPSKQAACLQKQVHKVEVCSSRIAKPIGDFWTTHDADYVLFKVLHYIQNQITKLNLISLLCLTYGPQTINT